MKKPLLEVGKLEGILVKSCWWLSGDPIASMILKPIETMQFKFLFDIEPQFYSGEIPIGSDMIHVSGGDAERDFENDWSRW